jgi:hypothetical protein
MAMSKEERAARRAVKRAQKVAQRLADAATSAKFAGRRAGRAGRARTRVRRAVKATVRSGLRGPTQFTMPENQRSGIRTGRMGGLFGTKSGGQKKIREMFSGGGKRGFGGASEGTIGRKVNGKTVRVRVVGVRVGRRDSHYTTRSQYGASRDVTRNQFGMTRTGRLKARQG